MVLITVSSTTGSIIGTSRTGSLRLRDELRHFDLLGRLRQLEFGPLGSRTWKTGWVTPGRRTCYRLSLVLKTLSAPMKVLRADLAAKRINYTNNPLLHWALTNMAVEVDKNENIRPVKGTNKRQRIDPSEALIPAYTVLQVAVRGLQGTHLRSVTGGTAQLVAVAISGLYFGAVPGSPR